jgi:hypothetical protein
MKKYAVVLFVAVITGFSILSCSDSESKISPLLKQTTVILNLGLPPENPGALNDSLWNRIRRFFAQDAVAQTAPANFSSILVRVIGADIGVIEQEFGPYGTVSLNVPSGSLRQFEVIASVAPGDPSAALSFRGTAVANLPAGETVSIPVLMGVYETKIVAPDNVLTGPPSLATYSNNRRIVMFNDMSGAGWASLTLAEVTSLGLSSGSFVPYDVSFDSRGRIYIANYSTIGIIRIDNINGTNFLQGSGSLFYTGGAAVANVVTVAVDRINNLVYFATINTLFQSKLDGTNTVQLALPGTFTTNRYVRGIDVDSTGTLYIIALPIATASTQIIKYDPTIPGQIGVTDLATSVGSNVGDILVQGQYIYVANFLGGAGTQILQLSCPDTTFSIVASNGTHNTGAPTTPGQFFGTSRFIAIRNDGFIVMDNNQGTSPDFARVVSFNNLSFAGWTTYGSFNISGNGDAVGLFRFFSTC